jgi:threonine aldolase
VAKGETPQQYGEVFDSISVCLSKGLGTPVGSVLIGTKEMIIKARRVRKVFGGGMRQAGYLAAACIYALENNIERLADDHRHARMLAECVRQKDFTGEILPVETNILIFEVEGRLTPLSFQQKLKEQNLDVTEEMVQQTIKAINEL